jgi:hypothetical protein
MQQQPSYGRSGGGGGGGGGSYGGGGGGGGGPSAYDKFLIAEEKRKQAELAQRKAALTKQLGGARARAIPLIRQYHSQFGNQLNQVFGQNRALNKGYSNQLSQIAQQLQSAMGGQQASLQQDLQGQGANSPDLQALLQTAQTANQGTNFLNQNSQMYNTRLAQAMAMAEADARSMGGGVLASSLGGLENSYANLLGQIGLIGLT